MEETGFELVESEDPRAGRNRFPQEGFRPGPGRRGFYVCCLGFSAEGPGEAKDVNGVDDIGSARGLGLDASKEAFGDVLSHENTSTVNHDEAASSSRSAVVKRSRVSVIHAQRLSLARLVFGSCFLVLVLSWCLTWQAAAGNEIARNALLFGLPAFAVIELACFYLACKPGEVWE